MSFTPITVTGSWKKAGPDGGTVASSGQVTFQLYQALSDATSTILPRTKVVVQLSDDGEISVQLAATNDPDTTPTGGLYEVVELIDRQQRRYYVEIPYDAPEATVDLATLQPMTPLPPAVNPLRIPPDPTGQPNGYVVTVENGVYTLQPAAGGGGYTGPVLIDVSTATPVDDQVAIDLSELAVGASSVTIVMPSSPSPLIALLTMPGVDRGPLPVIAATADGQTVLSIWTDSPFGPIPLTSSALGTACALTAPASFAGLGEFWRSVPPPGFNPGGLLQPSSIADTVTAVAQAVETATGLTVDPTFVQSMSDAFVAQVTDPVYLIDAAVRNMSPISSVLLQAAFTASVLAAPAAGSDLVPVVNGDTWLGVLTNPTVNLSADTISTRFALADGGAVNVIPSGLNPGEQMRVALVVYNGFAGSTGGTISVQLNGTELGRAEDIPVGAARSFQVAAKNVDGTITATADYGMTIPSGSPDY